MRKLEKKSGDYGRSEHVINVIKALIANFPIGSGIASLMSDYIPSQREKRLHEFAETIAQDLSELEDKINFDYLRSDEYAYIFEKCFKGAVENYQKEKIAAFRAILVNSLIDSKTTQIVKEYYLNLVDNLSLLHMQILTFLAVPRKYLEENGIEESVVSGGLGSFLPKVIPNVSLAVIKLAFNDLYRYGFINLRKPSGGRHAAYG